MHSGTKVWLFGWALTVFGLFAVYSTSIWKSFNQGSKVTIVQNIDTVKSFDTLLNETIYQATNEAINSTGTSVLIAPPIIGSWTDVSPQQDSKVESSSSEIPMTQELVSAPEELIKLEKSETESKLVSTQRKTVKNRDNYKYFSNQIRSLIISLIFAFIVYLIPLNLLKKEKMIWAMLIGVTAFQLLVFVPGLEARYGTSRWWIDIPGLPNMQPSEFFKVGYMFFMAYWISKRKEIIDTTNFLVQFGFINAFVFLVLLSIPDFGTIFILGLSATIMSRYYGLSVKKIWILAGVAGIVLVVWSLFIGLVSSKYSYALKRVTTYMTTDTQQKLYQEQNEWWQIKQGLIAVWGGGFWGQWYGKGLQKMGYLPEAHSDMIFDAFSEEIGFVGNCFLLLLYFGLCYHVIKGLQAVKDPYLQLVGIGLISLLMIQVFVHIWVNLEIVPNTGLTLPFVSHGGTALMINIIQLTFLYKILTYK